MVQQGLALLVEERLIDMMDDIFLIWQCCTSPVSV